MRAFFRGELRTLDTDLSTAISRQTDRPKLLHLQDVRTQIARALDPTVPGQPTGTRSTTEFDDDSLFDVTTAADVCWPDYAVKPRRER